MGHGLQFWHLGLCEETENERVALQNRAGGDMLVVGEFGCQTVACHRAHRAFDETFLHNFV